MICNKDECTGCFACANICPKNAIKMKEDRFGYIYPDLDRDLCIECNLCKKVCPAQNKIDLKYPLECYAARVIDDETLRESSSGGIATIFSKKILENGGVVYGAAYMDNLDVNHIRVDNVEDLSKLKGSKYVHSYVKECFKEVERDLLQNRDVLFIGTPCQIAGLKNFIRKQYDNLYLIDIICHGVPSQKFLKEEVKRINNNSINVDRVNFRDKKFKTKTFSIKKDMKDIYSEEWIKNPYFYTFMESITYRDNCYSCIYANPMRAGDITIGDFWGLGQDSKFFHEKDKGVSVVLPITPKGQNLIKMVEDQICLEERNIEEAINGNDQLSRSVKITDRVIKFKKLYEKNGDFFKTYKRVCTKNYYKQRIKSNYLVKILLTKVKKEGKDEKK